jgi:hypothetical protein
MLWSNSYRPILAQQEILAVCHSARSGVFVPQVRRNPDVVDGKRNTRHVRDHPRTRRKHKDTGVPCLLLVVGSSIAMKGPASSRRESEKAFCTAIQMVNTDHGVTSVPNHALTRADSDPYSAFTTDVQNPHGRRMTA